MGVQVDVVDRFPGGDLQRGQLFQGGLAGLRLEAVQILLQILHLSLEHLASLAFVPLLDGRNGIFPEHPGFGLDITHAIFLR